MYFSEVAHERLLRLRFSYFTASLRRCCKNYKHSVHSFLPSQDCALGNVNWFTNGITGSSVAFGVKAKFRMFGITVHRTTFLETLMDSAA
jgi:hypothetical protein